MALIEDAASTNTWGGEFSILSGGTGGTGLFKDGVRNLGLAFGPKASGEVKAPPRVDLFSSLESPDRERLSSKSLKPSGSSSKTKGDTAVSALTVGTELEDPLVATRKIVITSLTAKPPEMMSTLVAARLNDPKALRTFLYEGPPGQDLCLGTIG
jgi:hypothetical protein